MRAGRLAGNGWSLVAGLCLVAAAVLGVVAGAEAAFFFAVLGVIAWFWNMRNRIAARTIEADAERERAAAGDDEAGDDFEGEADGGEAGDGDEARAGEAGHDERGFNADGKGRGDGWKVEGQK